MHRPASRYIQLEVGTDSSPEQGLRSELGGHPMLEQHARTRLMGFIALLPNAPPFKLQS